VARQDHLREKGMSNMRIKSIDKIDYIGDIELMGYEIKTEACYMADRLRRNKHSALSYLL